MSVRRILITGANKGIGFAIARRCLLNHTDTYVIMACRSLERGAAAKKQLENENAEWGERTHVIELDTSSADSVKSAGSAVADVFASDNDPRPLYAIVNNAGIASGGITDMMRVNVRGPKLVDDAFIPLLSNNDGRIVNISSGSAPQCVVKCSPERQRMLTDSQVTWEDIESLLKQVETTPTTANLEALGIAANLNGYGLSKALLSAYTMFRARTHPYLKINACTPGMINTDIISDFLPWWVPLPRWLISVIAASAVGAKKPDEGTVSPMFLLFDDLDGNGRFYGSDAKRSPLDKPRSPGDPAYDGP